MHASRRNSVALVLGGVRSGKSRFAVELASKAPSVTFVATAPVCDDEMRVKIERHRAERPAHWKTREEPLKLAELIAEMGGCDDLVLVDCLTLFAANLMDCAMPSVGLCLFPTRWAAASSRPTQRDGNFGTCSET